MDEIIQSLKGKPARVVDGYVMIYHRTTAGGVEDWRCAKYHRGCPARGKLIAEECSVILNNGSAHNHMPDPHDVEVGFFVRALECIGFDGNFLRRFTIEKCYMLS